MSWLFNLPPGVILEQLLVLVGALVATALATRVVCTLAVRWDFVSRPSGDRWSQRVVPMGGGIALVIPLAMGLGFVSYDLLLCAALMFALGLADDRRSVSPPVKLVVQTVAACWMIAGPLDAGRPALLFHGPEVVVLPLTVAWYVGVTNSLNLLDNMDGSAVGVAAIAGGFIYVLAVGGDAPDPALAVAAASFVGVCGGFLIFNFPPAKIFMGDAGSLLLGFALAGLAVRLPGSADAPLKEFAVAAFILGIPLFDTALVWVSRRAARRPFLQGGRDHTTHRLVALGLSERRTVLVVYGVAASLGGAGIAVARGGLGVAVITAVSGGIVLVLLGVFLGDVTVYKPTDGEPALPSLRSPALLYGVELVVDVGVLSAAWLGAYAIRFDEALSFYLVASALPALPFVIAIKVSALLFFNLYRGFWRTVGFKDVIAVGKACLCASLLIIVAATAVQRFEDYSKGVLLIDLLLSFLAVLGSRSALRFLRSSFSGLAGRAQPAALYGSETLRPLLEDALASANYEWVGAVEPGDPETVLAAVRELGAEVVVVGVAAPDDDPVLRALSAAALQLRRIDIQLD